MHNTAAKEAEDKVQAIFEFLPDAMVMVNPQGHITLSNRQAVSLFGYAREELIGLPVEMLIPQPLRRSHVEMRRHFFASPMPRMMGAGQTGLLGLKKDGTTFPIDISLGPIQLADGVHYVLAAVRDITERKRSEETNLRLVAIVESSNDAIIGKSLDGIVTSWNRGAEHIFGYTTEEVLGNPITILIPPDHWDEEPRIVERLRHGERIEHFETIRRRKDGRDIEVSLNISPIKDPTGKVIGVSKIARDITERNRIKQRLRQAEKMEAVGRLAGGVAHDFNNVLAGVLAYGEMLFDEAPGDSPLKRYAQNVLAAATRGRELVEQILAYSRSQDGQRGPVDVANVVAETLELLRGSLPAGIRLEAGGAPKLPLVVISDATQLHQVTMNLCRNAIQAMSEGGTLRVILDTVEFTAERALSHGTLGPSHYVRLIVQDSGSGMDEATLDRIFEPFFTTKEIGQGTGLGLSLVYAIVTDSGGAIEVKSTPGQGSIFTVYLKQSQVTLAAASSVPAMPPSGHGERVLLIDDEAPVLAAAVEVLSRLGYEAVPFCHSHAALEAFEAAPERFDVVVTDEVMSGLTGTELARVFRISSTGFANCADERL